MLSWSAITVTDFFSLCLNQALGTNTFARLVYNLIIFSFNKVSIYLYSSGLINCTNRCPYFSHRFNVHRRRSCFIVFRTFRQCISGGWDWWHHRSIYPSNPILCHQKSPRLVPSSLTYLTYVCGNFATASVSMTPKLEFKSLALGSNCPESISTVYQLPQPEFHHPTI